MQGRNYKAFISYSHADRAVAQWLLRALESYRVPRRLEAPGGDERGGRRRLGRFFCDTEDLSAAGSLSAAVDAALAESEFLIVICSPAAVASSWVDEEIRRFKARTADDRILPLIVEGEPGAADAARECFPEALRHGVDATGALTDAATEPLAADLAKDGRRRAKLKLVAALLGVPLDELLQRDHQRQLRTLALATAASLAGVVFSSALAWTAYEARGESEFQRAQAEGLVEFMLTDLRDRLEPVGRLDALEVVGRRAQGYYESLPSAELDDESLARSVRALMLIGEIDGLRGDVARSGEAFRQAHVTTAELLARAPSDADRIYEHAQSAFWIGYVAWERSEWAAAQAAFEEYAALAERLVAIDGDNAEWVAEVGFAHSNLGTLHMERYQFAAAEREFRASLDRFERVAQLEPNDTSWLYEIAQGYAWLATAQHGRGDLEGALATRSRETRIYEALLALDARNTGVLDKLVVSETSIGQLRLAAGDVDAARLHLDRALEIADGLADVDPSNTQWQEFLCRALLASMPVVDAEARGARAQRVVGIAEAALARAPGVVRWLEILAKARIESSRADAEGVRLRMLDEIIASLGEALRAGSFDGSTTLLLALRERAVLADEGHWRRLVDVAEGLDNRFMIADVLYVEALLATGRRPDAARIVRALNEAGFAHPDFGMLKRSHGLAGM